MENENKEAIVILCVDDEANILKAIRRLLMDENYEVITAGSGIEGLGVLKGNTNVSVIISDQRMPNMTGTEFFEQAKRIVPTALRILLTGYADINFAMDAINKGGVYRYLTKPWKDEELLFVIKDAVNRHHLIKENKRLAAVAKKQNAELSVLNQKLKQYAQNQQLEFRKKAAHLQGVADELKKDFNNIISALLDLIELRDSDGVRHAKAVARIADETAKRLSIPDEEREEIRVASLLHDLGKLGMPDILLIKTPDTLNSEEKRIYMMHPVRGQIVLDSFSYMKKAGILVRHHHEEFNGMGFPDNLAGKNIPAGSKIIAMADCFDRVVNQGEDIDAIKVAIKNLKKDLGWKFDPELYPAFEEAINEIYKRELARIHTKDEIELELFPSSLQAGMVVTKDQKIGSLILNKDDILSIQTIKILNQYSEETGSQKRIGVKIVKTKKTIQAEE